MRAMEFGTDAGAILGHLTAGQRRQLAELDAAYVELLSHDFADKTEVEGLAEAVVAFYDEILTAGIGRENGAIRPHCPLWNAFKRPLQRV